MNLKQFVTQCEPLAKLGGWLYIILGALVSAVVWITSIQLAVASHTGSIHELKDQVQPIQAIRQDVRWIKKRLGGPDE